MAAVISPLAASVPVLSEPLVRVTVLPAVTVVPAAMVIVPAISTASRVCVPVRVMVPANWKVVPVAVRPPLAVKVQFRFVRNAPVMVKVPDGLAMLTTGRLLVAMAVWLRVWDPPPLIRRVAVPPVNPLWASMFACAASVPVLANEPVTSVTLPVAVNVVPAAMVIVPPRISTVSRVCDPVMVCVPLKIRVLPATVSPPDAV